MSALKISGLINNVKNLPFLKLIRMLFYDPVVVWCPCVIYEHLATLRHRNLNTVEIEMQLSMWCCREAGRRQELLHWVRQLLRSEMQGRKYKSLEEMEKKKKRKNVSFFFTGSRKAPHSTPGEYLSTILSIPSFHTMSSPSGTHRQVGVLVQC